MPPAVPKEQPWDTGEPLAPSRWGPEVKRAPFYPFGWIVGRCRSVLLILAWLLSVAVVPHRGAHRSPAQAAASLAHAWALRSADTCLGPGLARVIARVCWWRKVGGVFSAAQGVITRRTTRLCLGKSFHGETRTFIVLTPK